VVAPAAQAGTGGSFIGKFKKLTTIGSTVPANGDVNPYGTVLVHKNQGSLVEGNVLISNFNNSKNFQGTGTTIVQVSPKGKLSAFAQINAAKLPGKCPGGVGLTTALTILRGGWVVVGSLPTKDGSAATSSAGCLIVLDNRGHVRETGATWRSNSAGTGTAVTKGGALNTPLGLIIAPQGDVLTVNGGNGLIVETTPSGKPGRQEDAGLLGEPAWRRGLVRPGSGSAQRGRVLRGRRGEHAAPAPFRSFIDRRAGGRPLTTGRRGCRPPAR